MAFFKQEEKELARRSTPEKLTKLYEQSERKLHNATQTGDLRAVKRAMREHHRVEYALLFQTFDGSKETVKWRF